jgi:predicted AlkP superfamily phosphohydrolase/phosphomutase/Tfp pilus assembly protein PilF
MLVALGAVTYLLVSLYLPSSRRLIFGVDKRNGHVRLVQDRVTFLPPYQFYRLSFEKRGDSAQRDGFIRIESQDKVPVTISYRLKFGITSSQLPDPATLVSQGWSAWIGKRVAEAVDAVTRQVPIEQLLAPNSSFNTQRDPLKQTVARYLASSGLKVTGFEIARLNVDRDALLRVKRNELRRDARGVAGRVAIFGLDGADWELLSELVNDERMPNLKALIRGGISANVQTIQPTVSPMLWTTLGTGLTPDRHGVIDFIDHARNVPVDGASRRAPALWDISEAFGRHSMVVNWWCGWPPSGNTIVDFDSPVQLTPGAIAPAELTEKIQPWIMPASTVGYDQIHRFLNITPEEYEAATRSNDPADPINLFRNVLAKTWTDHRVAINLYREQTPTLFMMEYEGTDAVNHLFSPFHPPQRDGIRDQDYRRYWPAVANYYAEIDRLLGEWMSILPDDTTVIVMSAHGFRWGKNRPYAMPRGGAALSVHRNPGVFVGYGNQIAANRASHSMSVYDLAPTVLAILGLPQSTEMPGQLASWAFKNITPVTSVKVVSYSEFVNDRPETSSAEVDAKSYRAELQAVGHLNDPSRNLQPVLEDDQPVETARPLSAERWGTYAYYNNLGIQLRSQNKTKDAIDAFDRAIDINPARPTPYLNEAMTLLDKGQYTAADDMFLKAVEHGLPNAERWITDFAALYRDKNMGSRAIALLYKGKSLFPQSQLIAANLGASLVAADRYTEGAPELERALGLQPSSTMVLNNLGLFYAKKEDYARALDFWNRSLTIDPRQPQIRQAADAAQSRL